jgi:hemerythrin-like domain-containing protein
MRPKATDLLRREHDIVTLGLAALDTIAEKLNDGHVVPAQMATRLLDFFSDFVDGSHHTKEELILFPALYRAGLPRNGGPVACMLHEHEQGRMLIRSMRGLAGSLNDRGARYGFVTAAQHYGILLAHHIVKENQMLFRMADSLLSDQTNEALLAAFAAERRHFGADEHARVQATLAEISRDCGALV